MAYLRYSANSDWYVFAQGVAAGEEPLLAVWHRDHKSAEPNFSLSEVRTMIELGNLSPIPGYNVRYHDELLSAMNSFVREEKWPPSKA